MKKISWKNMVTLKISKENPGKFLNGCIKENIVLDNVKEVPGGYECQVSFKDFKKMRRAASGTGVKIKILRKQGMGYYVHIRRKRYGFFLGAVAAAVMLCYLTSCIWVVDVVGNDETSSSEILKVMDELGIGIGHFKYGKEISDIKNSALIRLDSLAWLWVTIDGTRAVVEVREKGEGEKIFDDDICCNLVASYPGQIVDMRVRHGRKTVERGDVVTEGNLLVSGLSDTKYEGIRYIHAAGEVIARTWRTEEGIFGCSKKEKITTGNSVKKRNVKIFGKEFKNIFFRKVNYKNYERRVEKKQIKIFKNFYLPLTFTTETFCEIILKNSPMTEKETVESAVTSLTKKAEKKRDAAAVTINTTHSYHTMDDGRIYVTVTVESEENIAEEKIIEVELLPEEYTSGESN